MLIFISHPCTPGRYGTWMYKLGETAPSPEMECMTWYYRNRDEDHSHVFSRLPQCPCSLRDVWRRARFTWTHSRYDNDGRVQCYRLTRTASRRFHPYSKVLGAVQFFPFFFFFFLFHHHHHHHHFFLFLLIHHHHHFFLFFFFFIPFFFFFFSFFVFFLLLLLLFFIFVFSWE